MTIRRIGIDFGTSTTVFAYKDYDKKGGTSKSAPKLLELGGRVMFPSIVFEPKEDGEPRVYGFDAEEESRIMEGTLYTNFKMDLMSAGKHGKACELIKGFFLYLRNIYKENCNCIGFADEEETWLSYPAAWPEQVQLEMQQMAEEAGFANIHIMDEPTAAINSVLYQYEDRLKDNKLLKMGEAANVLMIDMGAGTTDLVVCRFVPGDKKPVQKLLSWPLEDSDDYFGGREIDERLTEYCIRYCEEHSDHERDFQQTKNKMLRRIKKWKEGECSRALQTKRKPPIPEIVEDNVPDAAEHNDFEIIDRQSFESMLGRLLEIFPKMIKDCAMELEKREDGFNLFMETDLVILTGGNSAWYFIDEYILGKREGAVGNISFIRLQAQPERLLRMDKPQQTVAYGLTLNEKIINNIVEQFKMKDFAVGQQIKGIHNKVLGKVNNGMTVLPFKKKSNEIYFKTPKDLQLVVQLINEGNLVLADWTRELDDCPVANAIYQAGKKLDVDKNSALMAQGKSLLGKIALGGIIVGAFALSAPATIIGVGMSVGSNLLINASVKKQFRESKENLFQQAVVQVENIRALRNAETNATEGRKKLLEALEEGLTQAIVELHSDLEAEK